MTRASSFTLAGALIAILGATPGAAGDQPGRVEVLFEAATRKEVVDGDLKAAVSLYEKVVAQAGDKRLVAAKALVGMGRCHEHLGHRPEALKAYRRVVREFSDHKAQAAHARGRIAALRGGTGRKEGTDGCSPS